MARFLGLTGTPLATAISATCGLCFLCFGYAQGVMGGLLTVPLFLKSFPQVDLVNDVSFKNAWVTGLTVGAWNLGCIISAILTIFIGDLLGRRRTLILGLSLWIVGEIIQTSSYSFAQFVVGRAVAGFGNGFTTSTAPAYQAECVKSHRKGTILMISAGAFVSAGYALSYWFTFAFAYVSTSSAAWRVPVALQIVFAVPAIVMLLALPESPRWLILTGREQEALTVLAALNDGEADAFETRDEFLQIKDAILIMAQGSTTSLFSNKERRGLHRVVLAYFVQIFQQGTGINLVLQYLSWIFLTRMNYPGWLARLLASCSATVYFFASFIVVVGIDRFWGRRSLMMFGAAGMSGCMVILTILQYLWWEHDMNVARIAGTVFLFGFLVFFAIGWQGMAWLYQVEIVPLRIRGPANGLSTSANWLVNFVMVFITPIAFQRISWRTWIILATTNFIIVPLVYFFYPETAFRSLEEVDVIFQLAKEEPGNTWMNVVRISQSEPLWFGKHGEKRDGFNYATTSWHKRLLHSRGSSGNSSGNEKNSYGSTLSHSAARRGLDNDSDSDPDTFVIPPDQESPIDPCLRMSPPLSPTTTVTTTIKSQPRRSIKSHKNGSGKVIIGAGSAPTGPRPVHRRSTSTSEESNHSVTPDWWTEDLAPRPLSSRSRASSLNRSPQLQHNQSRPHSQRHQQSRPATAEGYHASSIDPWDDFSNVVENYPGIVAGGLDGGDRSRGRPQNAVGLESMRGTHLPDGLYEIRDGRVRNLNNASGERGDARGAGRAI